ncbi:hypothetical protein BCU43_025625 (plasmid) [Vibrio lentus]|nr:hypothetical protein [Vibrio lentus]PMI54079.1 hypothetical protein BCU43_17660 [Vibrio lentus]
MSYIVDITSNARTTANMQPLTSLSDSHALSNKEIQVLQRMYSQKSVVMQPHAHSDMLNEALETLLQRHEYLRDVNGLVIYTKTQTHNTLFDKDWFGALIARQGLTQWTGFALSMNHCASGLSAVHLATRLHRKGDTRPIIVLCGEKSIAPFNKMSVSALGEMATATLIHPNEGRWRIIASEVKHLGAFYASPESMTPNTKRAMMEAFYPSLRDFMRDFTRDQAVDAILPYNLNLPVLKRLARDCGWDNRLYIENLTSLGHTFCSDAFINFITGLEETDFKSTLMFAAGMGITFSALHLERSPLSM